MGGADRHPFSYIYSGGRLQGVTFNQVAQSAIELMAYVRAETCLRTISLSSRAQSTLSGFTSFIIFNYMQCSSN